jgi:dTDP-4-amino-4,6-dideoxygalactose transaminase
MWGKVGCYSCQTYKHINSGEGGLFVTDDAQVAARAIMYSGSYMLYESHLAGPPKETFETIRYETPNISGRMDNLRAAILRPQLADLATQCARWNERYFEIEKGLRDTAGLEIIERAEDETIVGSSIQFLLTDWDEGEINDLLARCAQRGVDLKWFGGSEPVGFTSRYDSWRYVDAPSMPESDRVLAGIVDMRVPLTFSLEDCAQIARIIREEVSRIYQSHQQT